MKKFRFSMQGILNVRNSEVEARKMDLAKARIKLREEEEALEVLEKEIKRTMDPKRAIKVTSTYFFIQREKYLKLLKDKRKKQVFKIKEAEAEVERCINRLSAAIVEQKKMDKAREHEHADWNKEYLKEEQKISDETGSSQSYFRKVSA